ncbi:VOC family protein [Jatrophihabitans sp.]|jgi:catechol 2,3-dioxygenase-like lactoylglutathione lyase family enzyme|uniref:VOC family protein n=1 Tax=Jatrophihabitans sp. TaxID=1932789 RepID=UPI002EEDCA58
MIGRLHHIVLDCPEPAALARFYSELLGWPITWQRPDFVVVAVHDRSSGLAFQLAAEYRAPDWPDPARPQQLHLDVMVEDLDEAEPKVLALGARRLPVPEVASGQASGPGPRVFADPAGHPFCLIPRPSWAPPIGSPDGSPDGSPGDSPGSSAPSAGAGR